MRIANKIKSLLDDGYTVIYDGNEIYQITVNSDEILLITGPHTCIVLFRNNPNWDDGSHTIISEFNRQCADRFKAFKPASIDWDN